MRGIALNFLPLTAENFKILLFRLPYVEGERPESGTETAVKRHFKVDDQYVPFWTLFQRVQGATQMECFPHDNIYATVEALRLALIQSCEQKLHPSNFRVLDQFRKSVEIVTERFDEGRKVMLLEPYYLRSRKKFGILLDFRFRPNEEFRGTIRASQLSLALNRQGFQNVDHYADRNRQLADFVVKFHKSIFPLSLNNGQQVAVDSRLIELRSEILRGKRYVFGSDTEAQAQFSGMRQSGPLKQVKEGIGLYFVYRREDHTLAQDLFRALRGDTFGTFPGMEAMFELPINRQNVKGVVISDFGHSEIRRIRDKIVADKTGGATVPIVLTPFGKFDAPEENKPYWHMKHSFLSRNLPLQVVTTNTIADRQILKWSAASIGLQVFAKLGGTPWRVRPRSESCLIIGIGQAHRVREGRISRFFAYSVLTDSSGIFEEVRVLGDDIEESIYIERFSNSLRNIIADYSGRFSKFVVHATFSVRKQELREVSEVLSEHQSQAQEGEFVSLKFNSRSRFFGFAASHNSRVPFESTVVRLSGNEVLVWFEGMTQG